MKSDEELVSAYKKGDSEASVELVGRYRDRLCFFLGGSSDAVDTVQETFKKVFKNISSFNESRSFKSWLFQIARNCSIDANRKSISRFDLLKSDELTDIEDDSIDCPSSSLTREERKKMVQEAILSLPEKQREVLDLAYFQGKSYPQIARQLDCSVSSVKTHMARAVQKLAKILPDEGVI